MGSIVTIKAFCEDVRLCNMAVDEAFLEMKTIDRLMSVFDKNSQLSLVNSHSKEKEVGVDSRLVEVLEHAKRFSHLTVGAFDVTVEPLMRLYGFRDDAALHHFPTDKEIASTIDGIGSKNIFVDAKNSTVALTHPKTKIDFGGIAVGYALDRATEILRSHGITSALINHSGDIYAIGTPPDEEAWSIEITDPIQTDRTITTVQIRDQALSTSGNYENFRKADGKTIGHLLNPSTGKTAASILSGTIIAPTAMEADALSTGFFVLGLNQTKIIVQQCEEVKFVAVVNNGNDENVITLSH
jgi:thiamine biosynthesis lipoprotein